MLKKLPILIISFCTLLYFFLCRYQIFFVQTSSMMPSIPKATIIIVDIKGHIGLGDVVTYKSRRDSLITHRIVKEIITSGKRYFNTKGDANSYWDKTLISSDAIVGKVIFVFPYLGYFFLCLIHPLFLLFFFYIPVGYHFGVSTKRFVNQFSN